MRIPYAAEQGNKSEKQGDKIDDQGIKSTEDGTVDFVRSGQPYRPLRVWLIAAGVAFGLRRRSFDGPDRLRQNAILDGALIYPLPN